MANHSFSSEKGLSPVLPSTGVPAGPFLGLDPETVETDYRSRLYHRGAVAKEKGQGVIPQEILKDEERRGFKKRGVYLEKRRLVVGSRESVAEWIAALQKEGRLPQRRRPVPQSPEGSACFTLRSQRARASPG